MGRTINVESAGKDRHRLTRGVVLAIRELAHQTSVGTESRDIAAFIALALELIAKTVEPSVAAWEKRDYWVKADKFRMEWAWAEQLANKMRVAVINDDWAAVAQTSALVAQKLNKITVPPGHRLGHPWVGAWNELMKQV